VQGSLSPGLASGIDIKDDDAASLSVEDAASSFRCLPFSETMLLEESTECL
jgi:hypothetical protein